MSVRHLLKAVEKNVPATISMFSSQKSMIPYKAPPIPTVISRLSSQQTQKESFNDIDFYVEKDG